MAKACEPTQHLQGFVCEIFSLCSPPCFMHTRFASLGKWHSGASFTVVKHGLPVEWNFGCSSGYGVFWIRFNIEPVGHTAPRVNNCVANTNVGDDRPGSDEGVKGCKS